MLLHQNGGMIDVWAAFNWQACHPFPYPADNYYPFEEWYFLKFREADKRERIYLPIFWTGFYVRANYGKDIAALAHLQGYINILDKSKKYYTIVQYDDGILNDLSGLDIRVYSMSGTPMHYPLPLICQPHEYKFDLERDIFMSFVGRNTHPFREKILAEYENHFGSYVTSRRHTIKEYCKILARSVFALCPRGHGPTSFRIMEALQYGAIPVYISDKLIFPHHQSFPGISIPTMGNFSARAL